MCRRRGRDGHKDERGDTMLCVTGDTHGEKARFAKGSIIDRTLAEGDKLFICGDFGFIFLGNETEEKTLQFLSEKPYQILFVDGNHENFTLLNEYPVEEWNGGKVHVIRRDKEGNPKIIHLMRGQVFTIEGKKIFTFGGANSIDRYMRVPYRSWWTEEMPIPAEMDEAVLNLEKHNNEVDYIITHAAPEETMSIFHPYHPDEVLLNNFLEFVRENVKYKHWYMGHLHRDEDVWRHQTILWFELRNMLTNEVVGE